MADAMRMKPPLGGATQVALFSAAAAAQRAVSGEEFFAEDALAATEIKHAEAGLNRHNLALDPPERVPRR